MNNNEEIIFSNNENNSENLNDTFFKNNKVRNIKIINKSNTQCG
jgi:hypothetical protein